MAHPALAVFEYHIEGYRRTWRGTALSSFVLPLMLVVAFGVTVGSYVDGGGQLGGVRYLDYMVPGAVASTALQLAFGEATWPTMSRFMWIRTYHAMVAAPLRIVDILVGELLFVVLRMVSTCLAFVAVAALFGAIHSPWAISVPVVCSLLGLAVAAPCLALTARIHTDSYFPLLMRFAVIPMSLFAGVFFPVESMPLVLRIFAYVSPLWHAVEVCRAATLGRIEFYPTIGHLGYLVLWTAGGFWLAVLSFRRRLVE